MLKLLSLAIAWGTAVLLSGWLYLAFHQEPTTNREAVAVIWVPTLAVLAGALSFAIWVEAERRNTRL